ncbi:MAG: hypothetical protein HOH88_05800 [Flavobacteriales bacterium]|jgi:hypothetical protein|nr:hypothetical protein [Flavobacteriales bacterium]
MNYKILIALLFHSTFAFQACNTTKKQKVEEKERVEVIVTEEIEIDSSDIVEVEEEVVINIDIFHTSLSDFISGKNKSYFDTIVSVEDEFWNKFSKEIEEDFSKISERRLSKMSEWSNTSFIDSSIDTSLVFYPFSGPDFLHVNVLYPNANEYILLALEDVGNMPNWRDIGSRSTRKHLENTNNFLRDIYLRSYFITKHMKIDIREEEKISGVLTSLYWFLSRTDHQIVSVERVSIDKEGNLIDKTDQKGLDGVRFHFVKKGEKKIKKLTYFSCDISDDGFEEENPELFLYLSNMRRCNTFVKSASYLMHYRSFKDIRQIVLNKSISIFQDDTGIPFIHVDNENWNVKCYGSYVKPIKDFEKNYDIIYQEDLAREYRKGSTNLPFSLGYHWRDASEQNQMLILNRLK